MKNSMKLMSGAVLLAAVSAASPVWAVPYTVLATGAQLRNNSATLTNLQSSIVDNSGASPVAYSLISGTGGNLPALTRTTGLGSGSPSTTTVFNFPAAATGQIFDGGTFVSFADTSTTANRRVLRLTKSSPALTTYVQHSAFVTYQGANGGTGNIVIQGSSIDSSGQLYMYENSTATVLKTTGVDALSPVFTRSAYRTAISSATATINGVAVLTDGSVVFGDSATDAIYRYNPAGGTFSPLLTASDFTAAGFSDVSFLATALFAGPDGKILFYNNGSGTNKAILSFDPLAATPSSTLNVLLSNAELLGAPAASTQVFGFTNYLGTPVYYSISGTSPGLYAIPEPAALGLMAPALLALRRGRRA